MKSPGLAIACFATVAYMQGARATETADWYTSHDAERVATVQRCHADPARLQATPDCINAEAAANALIWKSRKGVEGLTPVTFGKPPKASKVTTP